MIYLLRNQAHHNLFWILFFLFWWQYYKVVDPYVLALPNALVCTAFAIFTFTITYQYTFSFVLKQKGLSYYLLVNVCVLLVVAALRSLSIYQVFHFYEDLSDYWSFIRSISASIFHVGYYITIATLLRVFLDNYEIQKKIDNLSTVKNDFNPRTFYLKELMDESLCIKVNGEIQKIRINEILFIKAEENYSLIHTANKKYLTLLNLKKVEEVLMKYPQFLRIHKSYIVSLPRVERVSSNTVVIANRSIPFSRTSKKKLLTYFNKDL